MTPAQLTRISSLRHGARQRRDRRRVAHVELAASRHRNAGQARADSASASLAPVTVTVAPHAASASAMAAPMPLVPPDTRATRPAKEVVAKRRADHSARSSSARTSASRGSGATAPNPVVASAAAAFA
jgi:hypothetical protein